MKNTLIFQVFLFVFFMISSTIVVAQPWYQSQKIIAPDKDRGDHFGTSIDVENNVLAVGMPYATVVSVNASDAGEVSIFIKDTIQDKWIHDQNITLDNPRDGDYFGYTVDLHKDYLLVGAWGVDWNTSNLLFVGAAYLYKKDSIGNWNFIQELTHPDLKSRSELGRSIKMIDDLIFIGAPREDLHLPNDTMTWAGAVHIFKKNDTSEVWGYHDKLIAEQVQGFEEFGLSIDYENNWLYIGRDNRVDVYYHENNDFFDYNSNIKYDGFASVNFGSTVLREKLFLFIGAPNESKNGNFGAGGLYCFWKTRGEWIQTQFIQPSKINANMHFGTSVVANDTLLFVGALGANYQKEGGGSLSKSGAVYVYTRDRTSEIWEEHSVISSDDLEEYDMFGKALALDGTELFVSAIEEDDGNEQNPNPTFSEDGGSAYIFDACIAEVPDTNSIIACAYYELPNDSVVTQSGNHLVQFQDKNGCDSPIILSLTIQDLPDTSVSQVDQTLTAEAMGVNYQWLDCENNYAAVPEATERSFSPIENGSYAVALTTDNGCSDTSSCYLVTTSSVLESTFDHKISLYPNPTIDKVTISFNEVQSGLRLQLFNYRGQYIEERHFNGTSQIEYQLNVPKGMYLIHLSDEEGNYAVMKIMKQD